MNKRASGILLHITSLPSPYGIGDLGPHAYAMADCLRSWGQKYWQILPINPTDGINGHSPYSCFSAFAGNPLLVSPQLMVIDDLLTPREVLSGPSFKNDAVDHARVEEFKERLFDKAFARWHRSKDQGDYSEFYNMHRSWLDDYACFTVAKKIFKGKSWNEWPIGLRHRNFKALVKFTREHSRDIERAKFIQYVFFGQWRRFKQYANSRGLQIIGDIPIYVNYDSVEVWCHPKFFKLDDAGRMKFVSGCPPDYFSKTGQRWGNPVYDWAALKKDKYRWWADRIEHNLKLFDHLRIDHFRGFLSFWQIPAHEKFAVFGRWVKGPGEDFFKVLRSRFDALPIIAEDLGEITPDVPALMRKFKFPGMRVLLFGFGGDAKTNPHAPANYPVHSVVYTGTHDNNTVQGWFRQEASPQERANLARVLGKKPVARDLHWMMIAALMKSRANMVIVAAADMMGLGAEARMNTPATKAHNWKWRLLPGVLGTASGRKLLQLTKGSGR